jgi:hypothetical protein
MEHPGPTQQDTAGSVAYDAFYSGAIAGSAVALFFLGVDGLRAEPLFTPSLMGSGLFRGADVHAFTGVDLGMVAAFTLVHFVSFAALGLIAAVVVHEVELHSKHPVILLGALFVLFESTFALATGVVLPGVAERIGPLYVAAANGLAAVGMGLFFIANHQPVIWDRVRHPKKHARA